MTHKDARGEAEIREALQEMFPIVQRKLTEICGRGVWLSIMAVPEPLVKGAQWQVVGNVQKAEVLRAMAKAMSREAKRLEAAAGGATAGTTARYPL